MAELNPNHQMTSAMREHWQKIAALLVHKAGGHVVLTSEDIEGAGADMFLTIRENHDGLHLQLVDRATAQRLAREHGGLPS